MSLVVDLREAGPGSGGKATGLRQLIGAGLAVPDGFVITHAAFTAVVGELPPLADDPSAPLAAIAALAETADIPAALAADVDARARALGGPLAVRSSVSIEDATAGAAAGVMASKLPVEPDQLWAAIRAVWASACTPLVAHYARRQGVARIEVGVIIQRCVAGDRVTAYTRSPDGGDAEVWIQRGETTTTAARDAADPVVRAAIAAEAAIGATATGADVELIIGDGGLAVVQARPIVHAPPQPVRTPPPPALLAPLSADRTLTWKWDVEHNPEPLSVAQAGLVAAVEAARVSPYRMCTVAGYLYMAEDRTMTAPDLTIPASGRLLEERFADLAAKMSLAIERAGRNPTVREAVAAYIAFYAVWAGEVAPMLEIGRVAARNPSTGSPIARAIGEVARGERARSDLIRRIGDLALAWDVASPTLSERPELIDAAIEAAHGMPIPLPPTEAPARRSMASIALELSETDDLWFARAQAMVRRALLAAGERLGLGDDVFWLPLDELDGELDVDAARARAAAARAAAERARAWDMPVSPGADASATPPVRTTGEWRGVGRGTATGRVKRLVGPTVVAPGTIVVARAITPAIAVLVPGAGAIVSETGGILAHGAAIARELGIPFVVGCDRVWDELADGDRVEVDGDAGVVRRLR